MATSASGVSPLSQALQSLGVERPAPAAQMDPKAAFEGLARQTNVPANVLMALDEAEGGGADLDRARRNADFLGKRLAGGAKLDDVVAEMAGDAERGAALMNRSYDIADALYPEQAAPKAAPGIGTDLKDLGKLGAAGAINMTGGALQALGAFADDAMRAGARAEIEASGGDPAQVQGESIVRSGSRAAADAVRGAGDAVSGSVSDRMKQAMAGTQFEGELFSPSTWSAGEDPSIRGVLGHTAQGLGSMIPVAAASAVAGPAGAAVMGGLGAAGEGAQSGRDFVQAARGREGEAGPAAIEAMPAFRALLDQGLSPDEAAAELAGLAESEAAAWQAIPGTVGGAATGKILSRAEGVLNAGGRAARAAKKGLAGAIEEGAQEAAEGMASQQGIAAATGADVNTQQDSFGNFVLGALSGGVMGAGAGLAGPGETDSDQSGDATGGAPLGDGDSGGPDVPLLPAPENGGTIFGQSQTRQEPGSFDRDPSNPRRAAADQSGAGAQFRPAEPPPAGDSRPDAVAEAERIFRARPDTMDLPADAPIPPEIDGEFTEIPMISDTSPDGSGAGAAAVPGGAASLSGTPGAAATIPTPAPPPAQPAGPVERLALGIAAATPPARPAPPARFPDQKPGSAVRFGDTASGQIIDGVFLGETEAGARVRVQGREIDLTPEQFDALRDAAPQIEDARKQAEKAAKDAAKAKPAQEAPADVEPVSAAQWPEQGAGNTDVRLGNDGQNLGAGTTPGGAPVPQGLPGVQDMAGGRGTAAGTGNDNQQDGMGGVVLADDAGELGAALTIEPIREKAAVLRGWTGTEPPTVPGVSLKLDTKAGGWIFSRKHEAKVRKALVDREQGGSDPQAALNGEIITPEDDAARQQAAAQEAGFEMSAAPAPQSAPWWAAADEATRAAILKEAGPTVQADMRKAVVWQRMSDEGKRGLQEAYGRLYRAGVIENAGSIEAPRPALAGSEKLGQWGALSQVSPADEQAAVDARETPVRDRQAGLSSADAQQAPQEWPWRAKKVNSKNRRAALAEYLKPGNIVQGYGGEHQRVVAFDPALNSITIEPVQQQGSEWVAAGPQRTHGTWPSDRELQRGPVVRAPSQIDAAAAEANPEPTEAQAKAGNYKLGHVRWQGLDLSIENAKGSERRGTGPDGTEWSVTMPAHYGYFRGTEGADGDHVDFYMGDVPDSDYVLIVDQVDADTGKVDEHKVITGTTARGAALGLYRDSFSDGRGDARIGAITETTVEGMKAWLKGGQMRRPAAGRLDYPFKGLAKAQAKKAEADAAGRDKAIADLHAMEEQQAANGMVADARLEDRIRKQRELVESLSKPSEADERIRKAKDRVMRLRREKPGSPELAAAEAELRKARQDAFADDRPAPATKRAEADDAPPRVTYDGPVPDGFKKVDSRYFTEKEDMGNETTHQYTVQGTNFGKGFRAFRTAFHKQHGSMATELGHFDTFEDAIAATRADREAYAKAHRNDAVQAKPKASVSATTGLTEAEEARLAALKAKLAGKLRNQVNSGLDPEILGIAVEMTGLYVKGGMRKFGAILRNFMADTGLTASQSQRYLRAAYGDVRDEMDLAGEDVSGMDDAAAVMAEVRAALAEKSKPDQEPEAEDSQASAGNGSPIKNAPIKSAVAITARGRRVPVQYALVELSDLIPSQLTDGRTNPDYPQELQPRDRTSVSSQEQIRRIARDLNPELLGENPQASNGAPIILPSGEVLSGNGRTLALIEAMPGSRVKAKEYRDFLTAQGYPVGKFNQPVLVRITDPMSMSEAAALAREANERDQAAMTTSEQAMADVANLTQHILDLHRGGDVDELRNADFVRAFIQAVTTENEASSMRGKDGELTQEAVRRMNAALLAKAYGDAGIVAAVLESTDSNIKAIGGALTDAAPRWAQMRAAADAGQIAGDADRTASLIEAVKLIDRARRENRPLSEFVNQTDMFSGDSVSPGGLAFLGLMYRDVGANPFRRAIGRDKVAEALNFYATEALKTAPGVDLLGQEADTGAILKAAKGRINDGQEQGQPSLLDGGANSGGGAAPSGGRGAEPLPDDVQDGLRGQGGSGADEGGVDAEAGGPENAALAGSRGAKGGRRGNGRAPVSRPGPQGSDSALAAGVAGGGEPTGSIESADAGGAGPVGSVVSGNDGRPEGGNEPGRSAGAGGARLARPRRDKPVAPAGRPDYVLTDPERIVGGGPKARFARNRAALEAMQSIDSEGRDPTPEELDSIAGYIGWGSFGQELFQGSWERPIYRDGWKAENDWLREQLGEAKWKSAQNSIVNAHYTDPPTVMAMWDMVRAMGFKGGRVLEPSMGIGNFFSMMPADLAARSDRTGIELDKQTGAMAKLLFPRANISIKGYQDSATPDDFYDLVIGNWPFASQSPADRRYDRLGPSLHDYFFLKALDQTRPGGLVVGITSAGTMDKKGRATRIELAKKADLVAAYRLPSGAFEGYAGTSVVTDIIILKKRAEPNANAADEAWIGTADYAAPAGTIHVNRYFLENPDNVLGRLDFGSGTTYGRAAMIVHRPADLFERLNAIRTALPSDAFTPISRGNEPRFIQNMTTDRQGSITTGPDGKGLYVVQGERLVNLSDVTSYAVKDAKETESREKQTRSLVDMRRAYGALLDAERLGEDAETPRKRLKELFDAFRKAFGTIADSFGIKVLGKVNDPFAPALRSLERPDGTPATILTRSTMRGAVALENPTVADAYALNRNQTTTLDMEAVAKAAGVSVEDATDELVEAGAVLRIPGGGVEPKDTYLSGNVRRKLREVEDAISRGETDLADTAEKLRAVQPAPVPYYEIEARLGAPWVTADHYRQFIADMIGLKSIDAQQVDIRPVGGAWKVTFKDRTLNRRPEARSGYGVSGYPFSMLFGAAMGNRPITLKTKDEDGKDVVDEKRSAEANAAATKIRERFQEWVWEDAERTLALETAYNDAMRAIADPQYDGDFLTFPGMALTRGESPFNLRKHQRDAIWRGIYNERGLYAHEVGTGKTYTMAGIAVESRRYGKAKKPLILAHNANSAAVYAEAQEMYPGGRFLFVDNLDKDNLATTMQRIASDDWDAVIMPHSVMPRVGFREETLMALAAEEIAALEQEALDAAEEDGVALDLADMDDADAMKKVRSVTAKNLVKQRNAILERIRKSANRASKEGAIPFEELGIDMILVDEAHEFKKPPIATRMQIKGLNTQASDRSIALKLMSDYVKSRRGGTGIHLFTGTPITNALNEIFNMMNYVMDAEMEREGVKSWDMWFNTFADSSTDVEVQSTGEFEAITRLAQFVNVSELRRMAGQVLDIVFASDMPEFKPRETKSGKTLNDPTLTDAERDELLNGRTENAIGRPYKLVRTDVGQMSPAQRSVMDQVVQWSRNWKRADKKKRREYMLSGSEESPIIHEGIAAKASLDVRSYDARLPDHPDNKVSRATRNIMHHYRESKDGAQVVFVETGYNEKAKPGQGAPFSLVKDLIGKLVAAGIPETQIAVVAGGVKAEKKKAIADAVNAGKIRVVIGQTGTLGVGVNMQKRLRAMHHLDAPWMPGDLEQRNGRGERQGNTWNTVIEYRYLTEGIDGRRWQVLAIKDRFIKAFLRADDSVRVIEGDAVDTSEGDEGGIAATLSEATGDPRLLQRAKLQKDVERLEVRERQHTIGIAQAMKAARKEREEASSREALMADYRRNAELATAARDSGKFTAEIGGTTFTERKDAAEAFKEAADNLAQDARDVLVAKVQGFEVRANRRVTFYGSQPDLWVKGSGKVNYEMGKPTLASAEAAIRNMIGLADHVARTVKEAREAAERLEAQAKRPFAQAERLAARRKLLADIEADMEANPAAPPAWLRHGAPVGTDVFVEGKPREVQGHRWTDEGYFVVTEEGLVPYLEAKAENGTSIYDEHEFESPVKDSAAKVDEQRHADEKESRFRRSEDMTPADARAVNEAARAELEKVGLAGRVSVEATAEGRAGVTGSYRGGVIRIIRPGRNWKHTLDHEIIHALRDPSLWGARYGMFTAEEWHALVKAARANKGIRDRVTAAYGDLDTPAQSEEMVAELYADWAKARRETPPGPLRSAFEKVRSFFRAVASALRGEGFHDAAAIMERIASGEIGGRGPDGPGGGSTVAREQRDMDAIKAKLSQSKGRMRGMIGNLHWKRAPGFFSSLLTDAMGKNDKVNILSLVPGNPLFEELGKGIEAAQRYLREKHTMDAWRNDWQARAAAVVDGWTKQARKDPEANDRLMDLMHASTLAGVDPSREGSWRRPVDDEARRALKQPNLSPARQEWAEGVIRAANERERTWQRLKADFDALPAEFRDLYQKVRDEYAAMADEQDAALMQNIRTASKIAVKRADREHRKELQRIRDEGLTGEARAEALEKANKRKADAHARAARGGGARLQHLRQMFESNRMEGPYFPLARFGNYFVTIRDDSGKVTSFSRFQTEREQRAWIDSATERELGKVEHGVLGGDANLKGKVDPTFVADVESLLADAGASGEMMDAVWQRWLETLPDQSVRTNRIHRKGRLGFNKDAVRAFSSAMFHGAHQTARLRHGLEMEDALDDAEDQAKQQANPNRAGFVVREMRQRHAFTMSPTNNPLVSAASGLAFVWYLGMSPASAIVNLSQTTIVGVPVMAARFRRAGVGGTAAELARALRDFGAGRGWSEKSDRLLADEKAAMKAGYDRGVIDKTQSHDLAAVAESGVEYNPTREKVMRVIGWGFHHTERLNREVTFLAAYRMARAEGMGQSEAVDEASRQVWKVHFDYQNTSRPRVMQSDMGKILTTFRNFTVNMLYRLFRDAHQSFAGADAETRREARAQLIGISLSMFAHAGIKGVWGFGLLSMLLGAFLPGDDDDFENWLQDALLIEGDGAGVAAWNWTMGMVLNGAPGTVLDTDLTDRIGMPDLWFRGSQKDLEGKDLWSYYVEQMAGPVAGIGSSIATGMSMLADGEWQRGAEKVVPKFAASLIKSARYVEDGVTTYKGDPIIDSVNPYEALTTAMGFTPARVAERYRANTWLKNQEAKITSQRKSLMSDIGKSIKAGNGVTPELAQQVKAWNIKYPFYPITASGLRQSMASRQRLSNRSEGGVTLNPRLDQYLRTEVAPAYR